jgi:toluene monooxygenase system protein D
MDRANQVGPVLEASDTARAVVAAIRQLNGDAVVEDQGSYLRVLVPQRCVVTRRAIESALGRPFRLPADLEILMPAFKGTLQLSEEEAVWSFQGAS